MPRFETNINLNKNELQNVRVQNLSGHPSSPVAGQIYFNTGEKEFYVYTGDAWKAFADATEAMTVHGDDFHSKTYEDSANKENTTIDTSTTKYPTVNLLKTGLDGKVDTEVGKGLSTEDYTTAEQTKLTGIESGAQVNTVTSVATRTGAIVLTKNDVGLENVDNKSSQTIREELTSGNVTTALGFTPENTANKNVANGYAGLDANVKIPLANLPDTAKQQTYVALGATERNALSNLISGDKVYETSTGDSYIWDGTAWVILAKADWENVNIDWSNIINQPSLLALGETSETAYRGDRGKTAYDHSQTAHAPSDAQKNSDITKAEIEAKLTGEITTHSHPATTLKHAQDVGNGSATSFVVTHNFNTRDVTVTVREAGSPYELVYADVEFTSVNTITVSFATAPSNNQFRVIVVG